MTTTSETNSILTGSVPEGGTFYAYRPGAEGSLWTAYEVWPGGALANPRPVVGNPSANWRGLPELR